MNHNKLLTFSADCSNYLESIADMFLKKLHGERFVLELRADGEWRAYVWIPSGYPADTVGATDATPQLAIGALWEGLSRGK